MVDLSACKETAQRYAKVLGSPCSEGEKQAAGREAVNAAHQVCENLLVGDFAPSLVEVSCKALSYPLANASAMDAPAPGGSNANKGANGCIPFLASFATVLSKQLGLRQEHHAGAAAVLLEVPVSPPSASVKSEWVCLSKCASHLAQNTAQQAVLISRSNGAGIAGASKTHLEQCVMLLARCLHVALHAHTMQFAEQGLTPEQAVGLQNYLLDSAFAFCSFMDNNPAIAAATSSSSCVTSNTIRRQALQAILHPKIRCSFSVARAFEVHTRLLQSLAASLSRGQSALKSSSSVNVDKNNCETSGTSRSDAHSPAVQIAQVIQEVDSFLLQWTAQSLIKLKGCSAITGTGSGEAGDGEKEKERRESGVSPKNLLALSQELSRGILWLCDKSRSALVQGSASVDGRTDGAHLLSKKNWTDGVLDLVCALHTHALQSRLDITAWAEMCKMLLLYEHPNIAASPSFTKSKMDVFKIFKQEKLYKDSATLEVLSRLVLSLLHRDLQGEKADSSSGRANCTAKSIAAACLVQYAESLRALSLSPSPSSRASGSSSQGESKSEKETELATGKKQVVPATPAAAGAPRFFVKVCTDGLAMAGAAVKDSGATAHHAAVAQLYTAAILDSMSMPVLWGVGDGPEERPHGHKGADSLGGGGGGAGGGDVTAAVHVLKAVGHCLSQMPLPLFQMAIRATHASSSSSAAAPVSSRHCAEEEKSSSQQGQGQGLGARHSQPQPLPRTLPAGEAALEGEVAQSAVGKRLLKAAAAALPLLQRLAQNKCDPTNGSATKSGSGGGSGSVGAELAETTGSLVTLLSTRCSLSPTLTSSAGDAVLARVEQEVTLECCSLIIAALVNVSATCSDTAASAGGVFESKRLGQALAAHAVHALSFGANAYSPPTDATALAELALQTLAKQYRQMVAVCGARLMLHVTMAHVTEFTLRAAFIAKCPAAIDACLSLLGELCASFSPPLAAVCPHSSDNTDAALHSWSAVLVEVLQLYVSSYFCWAGQLGPGTELGETMLRRIKAVSCALDAVGEPSLRAVAQARGRKTSKKGSSANPKGAGVESAGAAQPSETPAALNLQKEISALPDPIRHVFCAKIWLLLAQWSAPISLDVADRRASDGKIGVCVYLTNALCSLEDYSALSLSPQTHVQQEVITYEVCEYFATSDALPLFHALGLHGRTKDQQAVLSAVQRMCVRTASTTSGLSAHASAPSFSNTVAELSTLVRLQTLCDGSTLQEPMLFGCSGVPSTNAVARAESPSSAAWYLACQDLLAIANKIFADSLLEKESVDGLQSGSDATQLTVFTATESAWSALGNAGRPLSTAYLGQLPPTYMAIRAWIALLCAKVCAYSACDRPSALYWARRALGAAAPVTGSVDSDSAPGVLSVGVESVMPRLEAVLLLSELQEQSGNIDAAMTCAAEALALAKTGSRALSSLCALPCLRLWHRTGSSRLVSTASDVLYQDPHSTEELRDDVTAAVRTVVRCLGWLLSLDLEDDAANAVYAACRAAQVHSASSPSTGFNQMTALLQYKHTHRLWNIGALLALKQLRSVALSRSGSYSSSAACDEDAEDDCSTLPLSLSSAANLHHVCIPHATREAIHTFLRATASDSDNTKNAPTSAGAQHAHTRAPAMATSAITSGCELLARVDEAGSFDLLRDVRRRLCRNNVGSAGGVDTSVRTWITGAASCGTAYECIAVDSRTPASTSSSVISSKLMNGSELEDADSLPGMIPGKCSTQRCTPLVAALIRKACSGNENAVSVTGEACVSVLSSIASMSLGVPGGEGKAGKVAPAGAAVFLTVERSTGNVLIGRLDKAGSLVVSLPCGSDFRKLLRDWKNAADEAKSVLHRTTDIEAVALWSDKEKREWWQQRESYDDKVSSLLIRLQKLLGAWRCLLTLDSAEYVVEPFLLQLLTAIFSKSKTPKFSPEILHSPEVAIDTLCRAALTRSASPHSPSHALSKEEALAGIQSVLCQMLAVHPALSDVIDARQVAEMAEAAFKNRLAALQIMMSSGKCDDAASSISLPLPQPPHSSKHHSVVASSKSSVETENDGADVDSICSDLGSMRVSDLRAQLKAKGLSAEGLKTDLLERLAAANPRTAAPTPVADPQKISGANGPSARESLDRAASTYSTSETCALKGHLLLLIDENLQCLPWESLPCLRRRECSRLPGLALLLSMSLESYIAPDVTARLLEVALATNADSSSGSGGSSNLMGGNKENCGNKAQNSPATSPAKSRKGREAERAPTSPLTKHASLRHGSGSGNNKSPVRSPPRNKSGATDDRSQAQAHYRKFIGPSGEVGIRLTRAWYVVDPEANLPGTRATMQAFLRPYGDKYKWKGYVAQVPPEPTVQSAHDESTLFIFCGHGAAEMVCEPHRLRKYHCPAALLWGCSSGHLAVRGVHDPSGAALGYLMNGAPYVLGNLWDVTDKDIDKLSVSCMQSLFDGVEGKYGAGGDIVRKHPLGSAATGASGNAEQGGNNSVAAALAQSRSVCKMGHAVGAAPVMYGLPAKTLV